MQGMGRHHASLLAVGCDREVFDSTGDSDTVVNVLLVDATSQILE